MGINNGMLILQDLIPGMFLMNLYDPVCPKV